MAQRPSRSLKHEYALYLDHEIEDYKESVPRTVLLSIGDEAVRSLGGQQQFALTELLLCDEVDKIIFKRLRLPSYNTWRKRRIKLLAEQRRPEHWGLAKDDVVVRAVSSVGAESHVLLAGVQAESPALYLAAHGCDVTALSEPETVERVMHAAEQAGLSDRVHATVTSIGAFTPVEPLSAVIFSPAAFRGLNAAERTRVFEALQTATTDGGVHLVQIIAGKRSPSIDELRKRYRGWVVSVDEGGSNVFLARKGA